MKNLVQSLTLLLLTVATPLCAQKVVITNNSARAITVLAGPWLQEPDESQLANATDTLVLGENQRIYTAWCECQGNNPGEKEGCFYTSRLGGELDCDLERTNFVVIDSTGKRTFVPMTSNIQVLSIPLPGRNTSVTFNVGNLRMSGGNQTPAIRGGQPTPVQPVRMRTSLVQGVHVSYSNSNRVVINNTAGTTQLPRVSVIRPAGGANSVGIMHRTTTNTGTGAPVSEIE